MAEGTLEKAFYRRGFSYFKIGDLTKSKEDFVKSNELADGKNSSVIQGLKMIKAKYEENKQKEIEMSKKMILRNEEKKKVPETIVQEVIPLAEIKGSEVFTNQILALIFDIVFLVYSIIYQKLVGISQQFISERIRGYLQHPMAQYAVERFEPSSLK
jgi:hypothetical protein